MTRYQNIRAYWESQAKVSPIAAMPATISPAAVAVEKLTGSDEWDRYLTWIQPLLDEANALCRQSQEDVMVALTDETMRKILNTYWYYRGVADAYQKAQAIPKELMAHAGPQH